MLVSGELGHHLLLSFQRVLVGYVIGCGLGVVIGVLMGRIPWVNDLFDLPIELVRSITPVAMVPLAIIWFGIGENSKYFIIVYSTIILVILNTMAGVKTTPVIRVRAAQCLGARSYQIFAKVILPSAIPYILNGMRIAVGFAFMGVIAAEIIAAKAGVGALIMDARMLVQTDRMMVGLISLGLMGAVSDWAFRRLSRGLLWRFRPETLA
jgi:NitT/TauT family transport system permease protein/taurine transport system permease protein